MLTIISAFLREERIGAKELLKKSAIENNVNVTIITSSNDAVEQKLQNTASAVMKKRPTSKQDEGESVRNTS
ncbi:hypothetical protein BH18THE2_BH18THE2_30560 [soil metagenome]